MPEVHVMIQLVTSYVSKMNFDPSKSIWWMEKSQEKSHLPRTNLNSASRFCRQNSQCAEMGNSLSAIKRRRHDTPSLKVCPLARTVQWRHVSCKLELQKLLISKLRAPETQDGDTKICMKWIQIDWVSALQQHPCTGDIGSTFPQVSWEMSCLLILCLHPLTIQVFQVYRNGTSTNLCDIYWEKWCDFSKNSPHPPPTGWRARRLKPSCLQCWRQRVSWSKLVIPK